MLELEHLFRVVDVHARLDTGDDARGRGRAISPDRLEREMHQAGVVRSVVFPPHSPGSYLTDNNAVARLSVDRPFVAFARVNGPLDPGDRASSRLRNITASRSEAHTSPGDVEQYAYDDRFYGFKLHPSRDGLPDAEVLDTLESVGLPVLVHGGQDFPPASVADALLDYSFPVVLEHFGGYPLDDRLMDQAIDLLGSHENLYLDTTHVHSRDKLERALLEHPDRVLFGSGAPSTHPNVGVMEILTLDVSEDKMRRAFSGNASRVVEALAPESES